MNEFAISSLLIFISCAIIGIFVYWKGRPNKASVVLSFFCFLLCFSTVSFLMVVRPQKQSPSSHVIVLRGLQQWLNALRF